MIQKIRIARQYPLLWQLIRQQLFIGLLGMTLATCSFLIVRDMNLRALYRERVNVARSGLQSIQEELRVDKQLGLDSVLEQRLHELRQSFHLKTLEVRTSENVLHSKGDFDFFFPETPNEDLPYLVVAKIDPNFATNSTDRPFLMFGVLVIFCSAFLWTVGKSFWFGYVQIYKPILTMVSLMAASPSKQPLAERISASGEIFDFATKIDHIQRQNILLTQERDAQKHLAELSKLASQLAHDIRSPLSALNLVTASLHDVPEEKRLVIRSVAARINDIANSLLQKGRTTQPLMFMLSSFVETIVSEKRVQYASQVEIETDMSNSYGLFSVANPSDINRAISNIVNNAVEAFDRLPGHVKIRILPGRSAMNDIVIEDNGRGIPPHILARLGDVGVTHGKTGTQSGSGLGFFQAKRAVESADGILKVESELGIGTTVTLSLPSSPPPAWFVDKIEMPPSSLFVSVDDDPTVHQIWTDRLKSLGGDQAVARHMSFDSIGHFESWFRSNREVAPIFYAIDYEFRGEGDNGLELIERLGISKSSILASFRIEDTQIQERAAGMGLRLLPKALAPLIPMEIGTL